MRRRWRERTDRKGKQVRRQSKIHYGGTHPPTKLNTWTNTWQDWQGGLKGVSRHALYRVSDS